MSDLVELVPRLLGFHPRDSLVLIVLEDARVSLTARVDLPEDDPLQVVHQLAPVVVKHPDATLLALAYCADACEAWSVLTTFAVCVPPTTEVLLMHADGRRWHAAPDDEGTEYDDTHGLMAVRAAVEGLAALPDRNAFAAMLEPAYRPRQVDAALKRHGKRKLTRGRLVGEAIALLEAVDGQPRGLTLDEAVLLHVASHDAEFFRSTVVTTCRRNAETRRDLWLAVVRASPPRLAGQPLLLLGLAAWVGGDGALMVVCLERLDRLVCDRTWADFLSAVNTHVIHPGEWEQMRADLACAALEPEVARSP